LDVYKVWKAKNKTFMLRREKDIYMPANINTMESLLKHNDVCTKQIPLVKYLIAGFKRCLREL